MTTEKKESHILAGQAVMAHLMGERIDSLKTKTENGPQLILKNQPQVDWSLDPNDQGSLTKNQRALLMECALIVGGIIGQSLNDDNRIAIDTVIANGDYGINSLRKKFSEYCEWSGEKRTSGESLTDYFTKAFRDEMYLPKRKSAITVVEKFIVEEPDDQIPGADLQLQLSLKLRFGTFKRTNSSFYPSWREAFN